MNNKINKIHKYVINIEIRKIMECFEEIIEERVQEIKIGKILLAFNFKILNT